MATFSDIRNISQKEYKDAIIRRMTMRLAAIDAGETTNNLPLFVWGLPGTAKSVIIENITKDTWVNAKDAKGNPLWAEKFLNSRRPWDGSMWNTYTEAEKNDFDKKNPEGWILMDVRLSQIDPVEMKGAPYYDTAKGQAGFIRFNSILPDPKNNHPIILLLDEFPLAPDMVQSAGYQLVNERKVGDYRLPEKCIIIAAGNPPEVMGVHFEMGTAMANRFDHINLDVDYDGFIQYLSRKDYDETVVAFLQFNKEQDKEVIYKIDNNQMGRNFPTFRSWEKALMKIKYGEKEYNAIADSVGQSGATKFEIFKDLTKDIPEVATLVKKRIYYDRVELQMVASQKVGNSILKKQSLEKMTDDQAFENFRYFIDMHNPKDKSDKREELTVLFLVNLQDAGNIGVLDKLNKGFKNALKKGIIEKEKDDKGKDITSLWQMIFSKWKTLSEVM